MIIDLLSAMVGTVLSSVIFEIIFYGLNKSILMLFVPIQKIISKIRKKELLKKALFPIIIGVCVFIKSYFKLNYLAFGVVIGFFITFINMLFSEEMILE